MESHHIIVENENAIKKKELYSSSTMEIIEVKVEKGFAASPVSSGGSGTGDWGSGSW